VWAVALILATPGAVLAADDQWKDAVSGDFGDGARWKDGSAPTAADTATFSVAGAYDVLFNYSPVNQALSVLGTGVDVTFYGDGGSRIYSLTDPGGSRDAEVIDGAALTLGKPAAPLDLVVGDELTLSTDGTFNVLHGSRVTAVGFSVGRSGIGTLSVLDGGSILNTTGYIGEDPASTGTATVSDPGSTWTNSSHLYVGYSGIGTLDVAGEGVVSNLDGVIGCLAGASGHVTVDGAASTWACSTVYVGKQGTGALDITNGGAVSSGAGAVGDLDSSHGSVTVNGSGSTWTNSGNLFIGGGGSDTLDITNGGAVSCRDGQIAPSSGDNGSVTVSGPGATWACSDDLFVGLTGTADLSVTDGGAVSNAEGTIGYYAAAAGTVAVDGAGSAWTNASNLVVGHSGSGTLSITDGGNVTSALAHLGSETDSDGHVTVAGIGSTWSSSDSLYVGRYGSGTLSITDGGDVTYKEACAGRWAGSDGQVTVSGTGSTWTLSSDLFIGYEGSGTVTIADGGSVSNANAYIAVWLGSDGAVSVAGGGATWTNTDSLSVGGLTGDGGTGLVEIGPGGTVAVGALMRIWTDGTVNLSGGTLRFALADPLLLPGGVPNYYAGTIEFDRDMAIDSAANATLNALFGSPVTIPAVKELRVTGTATLHESVTLDGGTFTVGDLVNAALLQFNSGTFNLTNADLTVDPGGMFGGTVVLAYGQNINVTNTATATADGLLVLQGGSLSAGQLVNEGQVRLDGVTSLLGGTILTNRGVLEGTGRIAALLLNETAGQVRAGDGEHLRFTAAGNTNAGQIEAMGGQVEFLGDLTNAASTGLIAGTDAILRFSAGLTNQGSVGLAFGGNHLFGDIANAATGTIVLSGAGDATFYDDVANEGVIQVSAGSTAVFFGAVTGAGSFTGTGTVHFEGDLRPGASPAVISFGGDVVFGAAAELEAELAATAAGEFDRLEIAGEATLDGTLTVVLLGGLVPMPYDSFEIMTFGSRDGGFAHAEGIENVGGYAGLWFDLVYDADSLTLVGGGLDGDADLDGDVDFDDFSTLAFHFGGAGTWKDGDFDGDGVVDFDDFSALAFNFGAGGAGAAVPAGNPAVPEPATLALLALGTLGLLVRRPRR
jgi:T5SS/PEP-CTERM-associated repeat protein